MTLNVGAWYCLCGNDFTIMENTSPVTNEYVHGLLTFSCTTPTHLEHRQGLLCPRICLSRYCGDRDITPRHTPLSNSIARWYCSGRAITNGIILQVREIAMNAQQTQESARIVRYCPIDLSHDRHQVW